MSTQTELKKMSGTVLERLAQLYHDPATGLSSAAALYRAARAAGIPTTQAEVKRFYAAQETVQRFKPSHVGAYYPLVQYSAPFARTQIDLMDMSNEAPRTNHGMKWVFCAIDIGTRFAYAIPMKSKSEAECLRAMRGVLEDITRRGFGIRRLDSDNESAFRSKAFQRLCSEHDIEHHFSQPDDHRATSFVERFNRTLRMLIERFKVAHDSNAWADALPKLLENYNARRHSSLGMSPADGVADR